MQRDDDQRLSLRGYLHHESTYIVLRERGEPMATADIVAEMQRRGPQHVSLHWRGWLSLRTGRRYSGRYRMMRLGS